MLAALPCCRRCGSCSPHVLLPVGGAGSPAGSVCVPPNVTNEDRDWLLSNFRSFRANAPYTDLQLLKSNFSGFDVLDLLSGSQLADFTVISGAISSASNITVIFNSLDSRPLADLAGYFTQFNTWNLSLVNITAAETILNRTLLRLGREKNQLNSTDYADWFQHKLPILLPSITAPQLTQIFSNVSCGSFQAVVAGLDTAYPTLSTGRRQGVYGTLKNFLTQTKNASSADSVCVPQNVTNENREWLLANFRRFRDSAQYADLQRLKSSFSGFDVLELLTSPQLADFTVLSGAINSPSNISAIFDSLDNRSLPELADYYVQFNTWNLTLVNITAAGTLLNRTLLTLGRDQSQLKTMDYIDWFQHKLPVLLPSITSPSLTRIFANVSCESFQAVVTGLDTAYASMTAATRQDVYRMFKNFLNQTKNASPVGSVCVPPIVTNENRDWLLNNFKSFRASASYAELQLLKSNFSGFDVLDLLTAPQLADFTVLSGAINSASNITTIFTSLESRTLADLADYYTQFNMWNLPLGNISASETILNRTLLRLGREQSQLNSTDYEEWFQRKLPNLLPIITSPQLTQIISNLSCVSYQAVVSGLDAAYPNMNKAKRHEIYGTLLAFLTNRTNNGFACVTNSSPSTSDWIQKNFGKFRSTGQFHDFTSLNKNITGFDVLNLLTVKQLAQLSATNGSLKIPADVQSVMGFVTNSGAVLEYIEEFNSQGNVTLPDNVRYALLSQVVATANLNASSEAEFLTWIGSRLTNLLPAANGTIVASLYTAVQSKSCSTIKNLTLVLNNLISKFDDNTKRAVYNGILGLEKDPSLRCFSNTSSFTVYLKDTFQGFDTFLDLGAAFSIVPPGRISEVVNTMSGADFAGFLKSSAFISNDTLLTSILMTYNNNSAFIGQFNQGPVLPTLSNKTKAAILAGVWLAVMNNQDPADIDQWFGSRLQPYFPFINKDLLSSEVTIGGSCLSFNKLVKNLNDNITLFAGQELDFYSSIKIYLTASSSQPRCYNTSDTSWLASYPGPFIRYSTVDDLRALTGSASVLQDLAVNDQNLKLINSTQLQDGVGALYASALFAKNPDFNITRLPDKLLCFTQGSNAIKNLPNQQLLEVINKMNRLCGGQSSSNVTASAPSSSDLQLAASLVERLSVVDSSTVTALGQQAVGLNTGQIKNMNSTTVIGSLASLSKVRGWNAGQAQGLVKKLLAGNFQFNSSGSFMQLGSLVTGLPSSVIGSMPADAATSLAKDPGFVSSMEASPVYLQQAFVGKVVANISSPQDLLDKVPDSLAANIPNSQLTFRGPSLDVKSISKKKWSKDQASGFFGTVLQATTNYSDLSASVLQGFQCSSGSSLTAASLSSLTSEMKNKGTTLDGLQASCLAKLSNTKSVTEFSKYPADVLLFSDMNTVSDASCKDFFTQASQGNINNLAVDPVQKNKLLERLTRCPAIGNNSSLTKDQLSILGGLVCLLDPSKIAQSDPQIVENLKLCPDLSDAQQSALRGVLISGRTTYRSPSSWNLTTFKSLGQLSYYLNSSIIKTVNQDVAKDFFKSAVGEFRGQSVSKDKLTTFVKSFLTSTRTKRGAGCTVGNITASSIQAPDFLITYQDVVQFDLCLDDEVLLENLAALANQPFTNDYLTLMKAKLDRIYPQGIPEDSLKLMGAALQRLYNSTEISKWTITTEDTLTILMNAADPAWNASQAKQILTNYLRVQVWTATALQNTGGMYLCYLDASQINISADTLKDAGQLNVSTCSHDKKDILYRTAKSAFASLLNSTAYYPSIQPYLGGAPADDLRNLGNVSMNIQTFLGLKLSEVLLLSVSDVKTLLGINVADLKTYQAEVVVTSWIMSQNQTDLDTLGLGLTGGLVPPTPAGCLIVPNATDICKDVNSTGILAQLPKIVNGSVSLYACAMASELSAVNSSGILQLLHSMVNGDVNFTTPQLTLLFTKLNGTQLELALEAFNNQTLNTSAVPSKDIFLAAIWSSSLKDQSSFNSTGSAVAWFQRKLRPFLSAVTIGMLQCLQNASIGCPAYQAIVKGLDSQFAQMSSTTQNTVYTAFVKFYLQMINSSTFTGSACTDGLPTSSVWLTTNFGSFSRFAAYKDLVSLNSNFRGLEALDLLTAAQLADVTVDSGALNSVDNITAIFSSLKSRSFADFSDYFAKFHQRNVSSLNITVGGTMLNLTLVQLYPQLAQFNTSDYAVWFQQNLLPLLPNISSPQLTQIFANASCASYQAVLSALDGAHLNMNDDKRQEVYGAIIVFLTNQTNNVDRSQPRCYNTNDTSWLAMYLGSFIQYSTVDDLRAMIANLSVLQDLSVNDQNLQLIDRTQLQDGVSALYASALFGKNPSFNMSRLPKKLLCFAQGSHAIKNLPSEQLLDLVRDINKQCAVQNSSNATASGPSPSDLQLAASLVEGLSVINSSTVTALGQQAVGLNVGQIKNMSFADVNASLGILGTVRGWDAGQAQGLVNKLLAGNFKFDSPDKFKKLGSLLIGLPSSSISGMIKTDAQTLKNDTAFVTNIQKSPVYLRQAFVGKLSENSDSSLLDNVPDSLADAIPNSMVTFGAQSIDVRAISKKTWSKEQASGFFGNVLKATSNYTALSASVLQGFQCSTGSSLTAANISSLMSEMKNKGVDLDGLQSSCLSKLRKSTFSTEYSNYPPNVLLFANMSNLSVNCRDFFKAASKGNVNTLAVNPIQKNELLAILTGCFELNKTGGLNKDQLTNLGGLVCLLNSSVITKSDPQIVENMKLCPDLSDDQQSALQAVILSGSTSYGPLSTWNLGTFASLGQLSYYLNNISAVNPEVRRDVFKGAMGAFKDRSAPQGLVKKFVVSFIQSTRSKRGAGCTQGNITASAIQDPTFILNYPDVTQFNLCLDDDVLTANLAALATQPLPDAYLQVVKAKLDRIYPQGLPEDSVKVMGAALQRLYSSVEISKWTISSEDTLTILMNASDPAWSASQAQQILTQYLKNNTFTATALKNTGGAYLCTLDASQISTITAAALKDAGPLNVFTCSQDKKDIFYQTAKSAFSSLFGTPAYYPSVVSYLGGASANDIRSLRSVSMSIQTFIGLNPSEMKLLSVSDVITLLGPNVGDLNKYQGNDAVLGWIQNQKQTDLDMLNLGLTGGLVPPGSLPPGYVVVPSVTASGTAPSLSFLGAWISPIAFLVWRRML